MRFGMYPSNGSWVTILIARIDCLSWQLEWDCGQRAKDRFNSCWTANKLQAHIVYSFVCTKFVFSSWVGTESSLDKYVLKLRASKKNGVLINTFVVPQYHYQTGDMTDHRLAPYQILCRARAAGHGLYLMSSSWLEIQPHHLSQGEVDPHEVVDRDDRPIHMRSYDPNSIESETFGKLSHSVR